MTGVYLARFWICWVVPALLLCQQSAMADIIETTIHVPVQIPNGTGDPVQRDLVVSVVRDTSQGHAVIALLAHGRPAASGERARMGQVKYPGNALWLAQQGFTVLVPTRIGYGATGGPDLDYSGECVDKHYLPALKAAVLQYRQVLDYFQRLPYVDPQRAVVIGESFGGLVALALAAQDGHAGITGVVNFAGGDGGDYSHLDQPCQPDRLEDSFALLGRQNHVPTLWMYSLNDRLWGADYPPRWFNAFRKAGGMGEFVQLPADKNNGHFIFNRNVLAWHADLERFFVRLGLSAAAPAPADQHGVP